MTDATTRRSHGRHLMLGRYVVQDR